MQSADKPMNGLQGLKHWRQDLFAGWVVSLISLPFSLGIAVASGFPPICGIITAIIAGFVLPFLGGSYLTISGPAAGLAPVLLAAMLQLGNGNLEDGYPLLLTAIFLTGAVQVILAKLGFARFGEIFPAGVVKGMLAAIGLLIIVKQVPLLLGRHFEEHEFWGILFEIPNHVSSADTASVAIGCSCLLLLVFFSKITAKWTTLLPPQVVVATVGLFLGVVLGVEQSLRIYIPEIGTSSVIATPSLAPLYDAQLVWSLVTTVITLTIIDGVESLATMSAVDRIDPFGRRSDANRTLLAMGVSNMASSAVGGLTVIPGGVKSTANVLAGGRTQWANFYNACFLLVYVLLARDVINLMPLSALAAIVAFTGYKLCAPKVWRMASSVDVEHFILFLTTVVVTVSTDLLWGIVAGLMMKVVLMCVAVVVAHMVIDVKGIAYHLFVHPLAHSEHIGHRYVVHLRGALMAFKRVDALLAEVPSTATEVEISLAEVVVIDHTSAEALQAFVRRFPGKVTITGDEGLHPTSDHPTCLRLRSCASVPEMLPTTVEVD